MTLLSFFQLKVLKTPYFGNSWFCPPNVNSSWELVITMMAMLILPLAIAIIFAFMAPMAMTNGITNTAMLGIQSKNTKKVANWWWSNLNRTIQSKLITSLVIWVFSYSVSCCWKTAYNYKSPATLGNIKQNCLFAIFDLIMCEYNFLQMMGVLG